MTASAITGLAARTSRLANRWLSPWFALWFALSSLRRFPIQFPNSHGLTLAIAALLCSSSVLASPSVEVVSETSDCARAVVLNEQQCEALGGRFETSPSSGQTHCNLPTQDAGKSCQTSADCESYCMADSLTCFGYRMMPAGCHAYVHEDGSTIEICFD